MTCAASRNAISSPESACGPTLSVAPDGQMTFLSGPDHAPVSRSARRANSRDSTTTATSGPSGSILSASDALQRSLESRLRARSTGSILYRLTWKVRVTPSGRPICALRASKARISASDFILSGWPTITCTDAIKCGRVSPRPGMMGLSETAPLAGWPTASSRDWKDTPGMATTAVNPDGSARNRLGQLPRVAGLAGWPTPMAGTPAQKGYNEAGNTDSSRRTTELCLTDQPMRLCSDGTLLTGSTAGMASGGRLNPAHSRWLMRLPPEWDACAPTATRSTRKRRLSSAAR